VPEATQGGPERTLQSAHLTPRPRPELGTHSAMSSPDSRIEVRALSERRGTKSASRWLLPGALVALLLGGTLWWQTQSRSPAGVNSAEGRAPSAPLISPDAPAILSLDSLPTGATVSEGSVRLGTTPLSLELGLAEGGSPRVLVLEKDGFQPYVVRQGPARGPLRVLATLSPLPASAPATSASAPPAVARAPAATAKPRAVAASLPKPAGSVTKPPSDIRLER
jgi:hypothetical protein